MLAPIVLFVYNRPWHARQTLLALSENDLADQSTLYIFCDGPKANADEFELENIKEVRKVIRKRKWCKEVHIIERQENLGLADSIVGGVTKIVNEFEKVIVLEDDVWTSSGFLKYMNDALSLYETNEKVMHISGYWFPVKNSEKLPETFFYNTATCWGWGTWKAAWQKLELDPVLLKEKIMTKDKEFHDFTLRGGLNYLNQLNLNIEGKLKTWAIKWYATIFLNDGYSLHPNHSLTNNIGHDDSGENCVISDQYDWDDLAEYVDVEPMNVEESQQARRAAFKFFHPWSLRTLIQRKNVS